MPQSAVTASALISVFASFADFPLGITSSAVTIKTCVTPARIKNYKSIIKKKKKKQEKIVLLAKTKLNSIEVLISDTLINSDISHDKFISINVLKEYDEIKEKVKNPKHN